MHYVDITYRGLSTSKIISTSTIDTILEELSWPNIDLIKTRS